MDINNERIAITCGDAGENHQGMEMLGKLGDEGTGFTIEDLMNIKLYVEQLGRRCDYYDLSHNDAVIIKKNRTKLEKTKTKKKAGVLILRNFLNDEQVQNVYKELDNIEWDNKYFDTRRKKVLNKNARENLLFLKNKSQEPDYENKKGRIVDWTKLKNFNLILENIFEIINKKTKNKAVGMIAEGNRYRKYKEINNKMKKVHNGIGWHGDAERRKVVCICIGGIDYCMKWQWFYKNKPINSNPYEIYLNSGDIYIMSEEAVGQNWKSSSIYTLRHCAGADNNSRFVQYKKEWLL